MKVSQLIEALQKINPDNLIAVSGKRNDLEPICSVGSNGHLCILSIEDEWSQDYDSRKKEINLSIEEMDEWKNKSMIFLKEKIPVDKFFVICNYCEEEGQSQSLFWFQDAQEAFEKFEKLEEEIFFNKYISYSNKSLRFAELDLPYSQNLYNKMVTELHENNTVEYFDLYLYNNLMINSDKTHLSRCDVNTFMS